MMMLSKYRYWLLFLLLFLAELCMAQFGQVIVSGNVVNSSTGKAIPRANISILHHNTGTSSNTKGKYSLIVRGKAGIKISCSHVGFKTVYISINSGDLRKDTLAINFSLKPKPAELKTFNVSAEEKPDTIFGSARVSIADFEFQEDHFIYLAYPKRLDKDSEVLLADRKENVLAKHFIPGKALELYKDHLDQIYVVCEEAAYKLQVFKRKINLEKVSRDKFIELVKPCIDTLHQKILFSDYFREIPHFRYYAFNPSDTTAREVREIMDEEQDWTYHFEYYKLSNADKVYAMRLARKIKGYDKFDIAASMTGFSDHICYEPLYAPLFVIDDTINIFDHYSDHIYKYYNDTVLTDSVKIDYHKGQMEKEWKKELIKDEMTGKIYSLYEKHGVFTLREINHNTGEVVNKKELEFKYPSKIKIRNDFVYYIYRPFESLQKKFLYREKI